jgi:hypothetical protein
MRKWVWLLPCLIWKYFFFHQLHRELVRLEDQPRYAVRLDPEFVLIYHPQPGCSFCAGQTLGRLPGPRGAPLAG